MYIELMLVLFSPNDRVCSWITVNPGMSGLAGEAKKFALHDGELGSHRNM